MDKMGPDKDNYKVWMSKQDYNFLLNKVSEGVNCLPNFLFLQVL